MLTIYSLAAGKTWTWQTFHIPQSSATAPNSPLVIFSLSYEAKTSRGHAKAAPETLHCVLAAINQVCWGLTADNY